MLTAKISRWLERFQEARRQHGNTAALQLVVDRVGRLLLNASVTVVVRLQTRHLRDELRVDPEFSFRFLTADEVREFSLDPRNDLTAEFADRAQAGRDLCFAALSGDRLAAYGWYALGSIEAAHGGGLATSFPASMAYMYKGFTHGDFRGKRLHGLVMGLALLELAPRGIDQLISTVDWTNWASLKSCYRLGYENVGRLISFGPACCPLLLAPRAAARLGVRFGRHADLSTRQS